MLHVVFDISMIYSIRQLDKAPTQLECIEAETLPLPPVSTGKPIAIRTLRCCVAVLYHTWCTVCTSRIPRHVVFDIFTYPRTQESSWTNKAPAQLECEQKQKHRASGKYRQAHSSSAAILL